MTKPDLTDEDRRQLERRGIPEEEVARQWELLRNPPPPALLDRPCTLGDGILSPTEDEQAAAVARFEAAAAAGRWSKMIPASGAASRMFRPLLAFLEHGDEPDPDVLAFCSRLQDFAFWNTVEEGHRRRLEAWQRKRDFAPLLRFLLLGEEGEGPALSSRPKGLILFHRAPGGRGAPRTPVMEHLLEAGHLLGEGTGEQNQARLWFTVSPDLVGGFREHIEAVRGSLDGIRLSPQSPATDTVALDAEDPDQSLMRRQDGHLLFRPGGHGALIENLHDLAQAGADLILIKNIDNVQPQRAAEVTLRWKRILGGTLIGLQSQVQALQERLEEGDDSAAVVEALSFLQRSLGLDPALVEALSDDAGERRAFVLDRLQRPLRVCGVVLNQGEPGGGPFWVRGSDGAVTCQIVEAAQIDKTSDAQKAILASATHFNPVDLACAVRDHHGKPFDLHRFVDPQAAFVAEKSHEGRHLKALERPGLWNGAMAHWNTVFLEVPAATFTPVKTVLDLVRPEHV